MKTRLMTCSAILFFIISDLSAADVSRSYLNELKSLKKTPGNAATAQRLHAEAMEHHKKKNYRESERLWYQASKANPSWVDYYFNLACSTAMQGKEDIAIGYVELALGMDKDKVLPWAQNDPDIAGLKKNSKYTQLLKKYGMGRHWVMDILNRKLKYTYHDAWYDESREAVLRENGVVEVTGRATDTRPCTTTYTGGRWSVENGALKITLNYKMECMDETPANDPKTFTFTTKEDLLHQFTGKHSMQGQRQDE